MSITSPSIASTARVRISTLASRRAAQAKTRGSSGRSRASFKLARNPMELLTRTIEHSRVARTRAVRRRQVSREESWT